MIDLSKMSMIDNHCHPFPYGREPAEFERSLCIGLYPVPSEDMRHTMYFHMLTGEMRRFFGLPEGTPAADVIAHRHGVSKKDRRGYVKSLLADAGIEALLVDFGYPITRKTLKEEEVQEFYKEVESVEVQGINRIEWIANAILLEEPSFDDFCAKLEQQAKDKVKKDGLIALKSVIAYLTGLEVKVLPMDEVRRGYYAYLADKDDRAAEKVVRDYTFIKCCEICRDLDIPLQIHTGIGDSPDCNLLRCNPFLLYEAFNDPRCMDTKMVLIHASYPYLEELGILLNHYKNLYADLSLMLPYASIAAEEKIRHIFEMAPMNKLFYGSDGGGVPEHMWFAALHFRRSLQVVLQDLVDKKYITEEYAVETAQNIFSRNVRRVYKI